MKRFTLLAAILAVLALILGLAEPGSAASTVTQNFLLTGPGDTAPLAFTSQLQCEVQIYGPNAAIASTPQYSSNGATWSVASNINSGSITQPGVFIGTNPGAGYTSFRLHVSSFSGSQLSGQLVCGDSLPSSASVGPSGPPGPTGSPGPAGSPGPVSTATPAAGNCIDITTPPPNGTIAYNCATPSPADSGQIHCTISGTTCTATATVGAGETCVVTYDTTGTTVAIADLLPLVSSVSSTTLTATGNVSTGSGDTYFDYLCF